MRYTNLRLTYLLTYSAHRDLDFLRHINTLTYLLTYLLTLLTDQNTRCKLMKNSSSKVSKVNVDFYSA